MIMYNLFLQILTFQLCLTYEFKCPKLSHWQYRASKTCISLDKYVCLENVLKGIYQEGCSGIDFSRTGSKLVFQPFFNRKDCSHHRYQPFGFSTYKNTFCVLQKSLCEEEGLVIHTSDKTDEDATCRCDYKKGYTFLSKPNNKCYCIPTKEDCTCIRPRCTIINQDYECRDNTSTDNTTFICPELIHKDVEKNTSTVRSDILVTESQNRVKHSSCAATITTLLLGFLLIIFCFVCYLMKKRLQSVKLSVQKVQLSGSDVYLFDQHETCSSIAETPTVNINLHETDPKLEFATSVSVEERDAQDENTSEVTQTNRLIRAVLIGKKGVGKQSLIKRLVFQNTEEVDNCDTINKSWKVKIIDGKWISDRGAFETKFDFDKPIKENISSTLPEERNLTQELQKFKVVENIEYPSAKEESIVEAASNVLIVRQESTNQTECNESERSNGFDYHTNIVSLHVEHEDLPVGQRVIDDLSCSAQIKPGLDNDFKICQLLKVEKQADFHLIHQIISPRNTIFVLVIDGTEAFRTNTEESFRNISSTGRLFASLI